MTPDTTPKSVQVHLMRADCHPLGSYHAPAVPREGEFVEWLDVLYEVRTVTWDPSTTPASVQVRVGTESPPDVADGPNVDPFDADTSEGAQ